jgi:energy-coupling factor transporter ATP-binding protein EcfA2
MRIANLHIVNYRSVGNLTIAFPSYYAAICGKNNSGKTNVIRALRLLFSEHQYDPYEDDSLVNFKRDYPLWLQTPDDKAAISLDIALELDRETDAGLYRFVTEFLSVPADRDVITLSISQQFTATPSEKNVRVACDGVDIADSFKAQELVKKLRASKSLLFHNSTAPSHRYYYRRRYGEFLGEFSPEDKKQINTAKNRLFRLLNTLAKKHQKDIVELLGHLEEKYEVGVSTPEFDLEGYPFEVTLGDKKHDVPLDDWGSGTRNRTLILMAMLRAKKIRESGSESDRITPIMLIEEPESFLHPSAQAEFGRVLQNISEEFKVQVITTTHSPYMLSLENARANVLLRRTQTGVRWPSTELVPTEGDTWMEPFALALGLDNSALAQWRNVIFKQSNSILLVEGEIDKEYFELLRAPALGEDRLQFDGEVFPYGGSGFFSNSLLMRFIMNRFGKVFVTYDLDCESQARKALEALGLKENQDFCAVGLDQDGKRDIEGLLPAKIAAAVYAKSPELVDHAMSTGKGNCDARQRLKRARLEEFRLNGRHDCGDYAHFIALAKKINRAFRPAK